MLDLDAPTAANLIRGYRLNLIKRGDDGSLVMSTDGWRLHVETETALSLKADPPAPPDHPLMVIELSEVARITWDRLKKQTQRSQVRFHLKNGDLLTFSGRLPDPELIGD
jgi:hypothetical protein